MSSMHKDWASSGLLRASVVNCSNLATVAQADIRRVIGSLTSATMQDVEACLKTALDLT